MIIGDYLIYNVMICKAIIRLQWLKASVSGMENNLMVNA
jgi:hypothetical protein